MLSQKEGGGGSAATQTQRIAQVRLLLVGCLLGFLLSFVASPFEKSQQSLNTNDVVIQPPIAERHDVEPSPTVKASEQPAEVSPAGKKRRTIIEWDASQVDSPEQIAEDLRYWEKYVMDHTPADFRDSCLGVIRKTQSISQAQQDILLFHTYYRKMREPGVYLDLGANEPFFLSNTCFLDRCLGWKGVALEPESKYNDAWKTQRSARLLNNCISAKDNLKVDFHFADSLGYIKSTDAATSATTSTCRSLEAVLRENADILGEQDSEGKWGSKINFVSLDVEAHEPVLLGCTDLKGLFSTKPIIQVWTIETSRLDGAAQRVVDSSMAYGGWAKIMHNLHVDRQFLDDIYLQMPTVTGNPGTHVKQWRCRNGQATCPFVTGMATTSGGDFSPNVKCP